MRCLTICAPFAELIVRGEKPIENRPRATSYRGPVIIHAGLRKEWGGVSAAEWATRFGVAAAELRPGIVLGVAELVDCMPLGQLAARHPTLAASPHAIGPFCWILARPRRLAAIPMSGRLGLYHPPERLAGRLVELVGDQRAAAGRAS